MATTVGEIQLLATINTARYKQDAKTIQKTNDGIATSSETVSKRGNAAFSSLAKVGMGGLIAATVAVGAAIIGNIGGAIKRIDTLVAFPRVLQSLGASSDDAKKSTDKLSKSLQGLPTSLSDGAAGVQQLVTSGLSAEKATDAFLAVNNALLVSGQGTAQVQAAFMQLNQALSRGSIQGQEWNTIASSMPTVLQALGKETGKSKEQLREMFRENPQALLDNIIRLNKQGGGGLASLDKQARQATGGIGTSFANMNNSIQRGMQGIVEAIGGGDLTKGQERISGAITKMGAAFGTALGFVSSFITYLSDHQFLLAAFAGAITGLAIAIGVALAPAIWGLVTALGAVVVAATPFILIGAAIGSLAFVIFKNWEPIKNFFIKVFQTVKNAISSAFNWVKGNWPLLLAIITGPIGLAVYTIVRNFDTIKAAVQKVWNWITGAFDKIAAIGTSILKGAVNSVLGFAERTINGFIRLINSALGAINKIPGVNIGSISELHIPKLAEGGIVTAPTLAMIGEGRESEAVIPLSKLDQMTNGKGTTVNQTNNIYNEVDMDRALRELAWRVTY